MFTQFRLLPSVLKARLILNFITKFYNMSLLTLIPIFLVNVVSTTMTSIVMTILILVSILGIHIGRKMPSDVKLSLVQLKIFEIIANIFLILFLIFGLQWLVIIVFILNGFLNAIRKPLLEKLVFDSVTKSNRAFVFSLNYWLNNVSISFAFLVSSFIFHGNILYITIFGVFCHVVCLFIITKCLPSNYKNTSTDTKKAIVGTERTKYFQKRVTQCFFCYALGYFCFLTLENQLVNYISIFLNSSFKSEINISGYKMLTIILFINSMGVVILPLLLNKFINYENTKTFIVGSLLFISGYCMLLIPMDFLFLSLAAIIFTVGELLQLPFQKIIFSEIIQFDNQMKYISKQQLLTQLTKFTGSIGIVLFSVIGNYLTLATFTILGVIGILSFLYSNKMVKSINS
ncbi:MFS transporter [Listeria booriae]|uniref:MFS transporter n=1 Tax=Listeria booriae TaxID=1552123 RepID=UPI0016266656|nr:MFS transporter [Listeria booriae]